ncbi:hypothetical protein [Amaricoccus solimangrovi]|uniref:Anti-sigma factor n=1 Tax=Amaricoccus solimangrovi TaxID=2589815 RepID=A0A501WUF4_9RHOB|nr:hypothetical protein [Amaricoccus solimangrovi]TPE51007.1 hypothetical protein FJM51_10245 [Amaricoccus solimangrovi]
MTELPDRPDDAMLMDYVRGVLGAGDTAAVERAARASAEVRADIALMRGLVNARATADESTPGELGWARLSRALDAEAGAEPHAGARARTGAAPPRRWREPLRIAAAALLAVGLWQFGVVPFLGNRGDEGLYRPATKAEAGTVTVAFVPEATEARIRALLGEIGAVVTGGPSALGLWTLGFPDLESRDAGLRRLLAEPSIVESAQAN